MVNSVMDECSASTGPNEQRPKKRCKQEVFGVDIILTPCTVHIRSIFAEKASQTARFASMFQQNTSQLSNVVGHSTTLNSRLRPHNPEFRRQSPRITAVMNQPATCAASTVQPSALVTTPPEYWDIGQPTCKCAVCDAYFWYDEKLVSSCSKENPLYSKCCGNGKVELPVLKRPPDVLVELLFGDGLLGRQFRNNIRGYNCMFCFTSMGRKIDSSFNDGKSPPTFRLHGANYHSVGSLLPAEGRQPRFAQLYIYDTNHEISNRIEKFRLGEEHLHEVVVCRLQHMLDANKVLVKSFRMARDGLAHHKPTDDRLRLIARRTTDLRSYNIPTVSEVAALLVGDFDASTYERDIIVESRSGCIQRISQLHPTYLGLQYPLLFPYGEDGYTENIPFRESYKFKVRKKTSEREYFAYRLHDRAGKLSIILFARRLFQQFLSSLGTTF